MKFVPVTAQDLYFSPTVKIEYAQTQCGRLLRSRFYETHVCVEEFSVGFYEKRSRFDTLLCTYRRLPSTEWQRCPCRGYVHDPLPTGCKRGMFNRLRPARRRWFVLRSSTSQHEESIRRKSWN